MSDISTLNDIVSTATKVEEFVVEGNPLAKSVLDSNELFPLEKPYIQSLAKDVRNDYLSGYDDKWNRVDLDQIINSIKKVKGRYVPSFAIYDLFSRDNIYNLGFTISRRNYYDTTKRVKLLSGLKGIKGLLYSLYVNHVELSVKQAFIEIGIMLSMYALGCILVSNKFDLLFRLLLGIMIGLISTLVYCFVGLTLNVYFDNIMIESGFKHTFKGIIPKNVKEHILSIRDKFNKIYLVEEATAWELNDKVMVNTSKNIEPLIIGEKFGKYFLLNKFDLTDLESYVSKEMTSTVDLVKR